MFQSLFGSRSKEQILIYLNCQERGYAREIAKFFAVPVTPIQKQLESLEAQNLLYSVEEGRTRLYSINPRYPLIKELRALLDKAVSFYPPAQREALLKDRRRPRRKGKPLEL